MADSSKKSIALTLPTNTLSSNRFVIDVADNDVIDVYSSLTNSATGYVEITNGDYVGQELVVRNINRGTGQLKVGGLRGTWYGFVWTPNVALSTTSVQNGYSGTSNTSKQDGTDTNPYITMAIFRWSGDLWYCLGGIGVTTGP